MLDRKYAQLGANKAVELLNIDSPTGFTENIAAKLVQEFTSLGYKCELSNKGNVLVTVSSPDSSPNSSPNNDVILFEAHGDTLGAMVKQIKSNGRLLVSPLGGLVAANVETENVRVYTRDNKIYEGTFQLENASSHVNKDLRSKERSFDTVEIVLDERVNSKEDVKKLGISVGDFVCVEPRAHITNTGYIKSRFLDDKLSVGTLLAFATYLKENNIKLNKKAYFLITVYEEVGHGGACIPNDVTEAISVDMGCVGDGLECTETQVSICAKDSGGPYDKSVVDKLVKAAIKEDADYAIDVYPYYGSDVEATLSAGYDVKHGLIGPGVYASHGYERSHIDGVYNTLKVLKAYLEDC